MSSPPYHIPAIMPLLWPAFVFFYHFVLRVKKWQEQCGETQKSKWLNMKNCILIIILVSVLCIFQPSSTTPIILVFFIHPTPINKNILALSLITSTAHARHSSSPLPLPPHTQDHLAAISARRPAKVNILFFVSDDLRTDVLMDNVTPNFNRLANTSLSFTRAYSAQSVCAPSRFSFLSGRRPDVLQAWTFLTPMRQNARLVQSIPQIFMNAGYYTESIGKVFHYINLPNVLDDRAWSWNKVLLPANQKEDITQCPNAFIYCSCQPTKCDDAMIATDAIAALKSFTNMNKPFFLGVGFRRPHTSWIVPQTFRNSFISASPYQNSLPLYNVPPNFNKPSGMPTTAFYSCSGVTDTVQFMNLPMLPNIPVDPVTTSQMRREYATSASYMDSQLGLVLDALDASPFADNTIVIFTSDHGFSLGEKNMWCKQSVFEHVTSVPLLLRVPWVKDTSYGKTVTTVVELLDLMPTLVSLAGPSVSFVMNKCPMGRDLSPFLTDQNHASAGDADPYGGIDISGDGTGGLPRGHQSWALSQYPRCGMNVVPLPKNPWQNPCTGVQSNTFDYMGYSIRTQRWRYTEWRVWLRPLLMADWSSDGLNSTELYDHGTDTGLYPSADLFENENVAEKFPEVVAGLSAALRQVAVVPASYPGLCQPQVRGTIAPTSFPSNAPHPPTKSPIVTASPRITTSPTTAKPTIFPTRKTQSPSAAQPTSHSPTTQFPTTSYPTSLAPRTSVPSSPLHTTISPTSVSPTVYPSYYILPTRQPTQSPVTESPTSMTPSTRPSMQPSPHPSMMPSVMVTMTKSSNSPSVDPSSSSLSPTQTDGSTCSSLEQTCANGDWTCGIPISNECGMEFQCPCWTWEQ